VSAPIPSRSVIAWRTLRGGGFLLFGKVDDGKALAQSPLLPRPAMDQRIQQQFLTAPQHA